MNNLPKQIGTFVLMFIGGIAGILFYTSLPSPETATLASETVATSNNDWWFQASLLLQFVVILYTVILIHELGHTFGAYLADYTPYQVIVGPITIDFSGNYWRLRWNNDLMFDGMSISVSKHNRNSRWRFLAYIIAGPLTTLITGLLSYGIWLLLPQSPLSITLQLFAGTSAIIFLLTCIPIPLGNLTVNDGYCMMKLIFKYDDEARAWVASNNITAMLASGQSLQTVDKSVLDDVRANPNDDYSITLYEYVIALEIGDTQELIQSATALEGMVEGGKLNELPLATRNILKAELAFFYGWVAPDREKFQRFYEASAKALQSPSAPHYRLKAAHHRMAGQFDTMTETLLEAQQFLQTDRSFGYGSEQLIIKRLLADPLPATDPLLA